jgi:single-stranded-DNA-specific exonuclease
MENREPVFAARAVRLMAPPQAVKDKHVKLRVAPGGVAPTGVGTGQSPATTQASSSRRNNVAFKAMGWGLKESCDRLQLLAGDRLDIAYSLGMNDHPEFGGLELTLRDLVRAR